MEKGLKSTLDIEEKILSIVRELLYNERIDAEADLFDAGLNSIIATQMMSRIQQATGISLGLHEIFDQLDTEIFNVNSLIRIAGEVTPLRETTITKLPEASSYEVSLVQQRLWLLEKFNGGRYPSSIPVQIIFREDVQVSALKLALTKLLERHQSLRTTYIEDDNGVRQTILAVDEIAFVMPVTDISDTENVEVILKETALAEARHIFDLSTDVLLKAKLLRTSRNHNHCFITIHHIAADGWSASVLLKELFELYDACKAGLTLSFPPIEVQFRDYAVWYNTRIGERFEENRKFWNEYLGGNSSRIHLANRKQRPAIKSYEGRRTSFLFSPETAAGLTILSQKTNVTLFNTLVALLNVLFYRYTNHGSITLGTSVANRGYNGVENLVGYFLSVIALRTEVRKGDTFAAVIERTKTNTLLAYKHQEYPFDQVVNDLDKDRDARFSPIFDVVVLLHNYENPIVPEAIPLNEKDLRSVLETDNQTCIVDLFLEFFQIKNQLVLNVRYDTSIYDGEQVALFFEHFQRLANVALTDINTDIDAADFLSDRENERYAIPPKTVDGESAVSRIRAMRNLFPDSIAVASLENKFTYAELFERCGHIRQLLYNCNKNVKGEVVCVLMDRSPDMVAALLAIWQCGGIYVPIEPGIPAERIKAILSDTDATCLLTTTQYDSVQLKVNYRIRIDLDQSSPSVHPLQEAISRPDNIAYIIYTSGSTGLPKGAVISHRGMQNHLEAKVTELQMTKDTILAQNASQGFDISIWQMIAPLLVGGQAYIINQETVLAPHEFVNIIKLSHITILEVVPSYLAALMDEFEKADNYFFDSLRFLLITGEAVQPGLTQRWFNKFPTVTLVNAYGPTEASDDVTHFFMTSPQYERVPVGFPVLNTRIYILNDQLAKCPEGTIGEIFIAGKGVGLGYLNDPIKTSSSFPENPLYPGQGKVYKTGDLGRYLRDGSIEFFGRKDQQVKLFGYRIELGEIEMRIAVLTGSPMVSVQLFNDEQQLPYLAAFIQCTGPFNLILIKENLRSYLPEYMVPSMMMQVETMPLTVNGKIDVKKLTAQIPKHTQEQTALPVNNVEHTLLLIWNNVLKRNDESVNLDFFKAGGYSLLANQMLLQIHREIGVRLELREIFAYPTVRSLAKVIQISSATAYTEVPHIEEQDFYAVSHAQKRLWILQQMNRNEVAYNVHGSYIINKGFDETLLIKATCTLIGNHEILRTTFPVINGSPVQKVNDKYDTGFVEVLDWSDRTEPREFLIRKELESFIIIPFDLEQDFPVRIRLVNWGDGTGAMLMILHHIVSDGWSKGILEEELFNTYTSLLSDKSLPIEKNPLQYRNYSAWQNERIKLGKFDVHRNYWLNKLGNEINDVLELPGCAPRPTIQSFNGSSVESTISSDLRTALFEYCRRHGVTTFIGLLSLQLVFLYKLTARKKITIGATLAGRSHHSIEKLVGFFVNTLPVRYTIIPSANFEYTINEVKEIVLEMLAHDGYPFDLLVEDLNINREFNRNAVFDILVEVHQFDQLRQGLKKFTDSSRPFNVFEIGIPEVSSIYDLNVVFKEKEDDLCLHIRYNTDLYKESQVNEFASYFQSLAMQVLADDQRNLQSITPFGKNDHEGFNLVEELVENEDTILKRIQSQVNSSPDQTAIRYNQKVLSYADLHSRYSKVGEFLASVPLQNPIVGLLMDRSPEMIESILGLWSCGRAYLPLDGESPFERLSFVVKDAGLEMLVFNKKYLKEAQMLQWYCKSLRFILCIDSDSIMDETESLNESMRKELWEYVGEKSVDDITGGGWINSYTGLPFSREEMQEYADNTVTKLSPFLTRTTRVLEIGCASGISMFSIAPMVGHYVGTDLSGVIMEKNRERVRREKISNIDLTCMYAHEIDALEAQDFDIIVINSVVQNFNGFNYLREVVRKAIGKITDKGIIFIGDVMDADRKTDLIRSLTLFDERSGGVFATKLEWEDELFVSKDFFYNIPAELDGIGNVQITEKNHTIKNELSEFRYDVVMHVDRSASRKESEFLKKVFDRSDIDAKTGRGFIDRSRPQDIAYVIYTSGSTGDPKGAIVEQVGMLNHAIAKIGDLQITRSSVVAQNASHCFDISVWQFFCALMAGGITEIFTKDEVRNIEAFAELLDNRPVTILEVVPSYLNELLQITTRFQAKNWTSKLKFLVVTGEAVHKPLVVQWFSEFPGIPMVNAYGPTEASDDVTHHIMNRPPAGEEVPIGRPLPGFRIQIISKEGSSCPPGVKGELKITGKGVGRGYLNNPEKTHSVFSQLSANDRRLRSYMSGDIGKYNLDGTISFAGRDDYQVKIRGHRIELGEIEQKLVRIKGIREAIVLVNYNSENEASLRAYIVLTESHSLDTDKIRKKLAGLVPDYMIPQSINLLRKLPVNANGKVDRKALLQMSVNPYEGNGKLTDNPLAEKLIAIWQQVLNRPVPSMDSNFFELGGHSLKATRLMSLIHKEMNMKISLRDIFLQPTLRQLTLFIEQSGMGEKYERIPRAPYQPHYELSHSQKRIWILSQFEGGLKAYCENGSVTIGSRINSAVFSQAIDGLLAKHEILRTTYSLVDGEPRQKINEHRTGISHLINLDYRGREFSIDQFFTNQQNIPFDLTTGPLIRFWLVQITDDYSYFLFSAHHIICDGWSGRVFLRDIISNYLYFSGRIPKIENRSEIQYKDFAVWQNKQISKSTFNIQKEFWLKQLQGELPRLDIPTSYPRSAVFTHAGNTHQYLIDQELYTRLNTLSRNSDTTLFMTLVSVLNVLFFRYTGQSDIVLGTSVSGREHYELEGQIGFFLNSLALRNNFGSQMSFKEMLSIVRKNILAAFQHQQFPFDMLVEELHLKRDLSRSAVFDVLVELQNFEEVLPVSIDVKEAYESLEIRPNETRKTSSQMDMNWSFFEREGSLRLNLVYNTDLYSSSFIEQLVSHFKLLAGLVTANPSLSISSYDLTAPRDHTRLSLCNNASFVIPEVPFIYLFEQSVNTCPDKIAIRCGGTSMSYRELDNKANTVATLLLDAGLRKEDGVCVYCQRNANYAAIVLGIFKAGCTYLPIDPGFTWNRVMEILIDSAAPCLIVASDSLQPDLLHDLSEKTQVREVINNEGGQFSYHDSFTRISANETSNKSSGERPGLYMSDLAYIIYTSGSTGKPKGVMIDQLGMLNHLMIKIYDLGINSGSVIAQSASQSFDISIWQFLAAFIQGGEIVVYPYADVLQMDHLVKEIISDRITIIELVPSYLRLFLDNFELSDIKSEFTHLEFIVVTGEALTTNLANRAYRLLPGARIVNAYGPTEASDDITHYVITGPVSGDVPIGKVLANLKIYIIDDFFNLSPFGAKGEICVSGVGIGRGYLNDISKTTYSFVDNPFDSGEFQRIYRTGDIGRYNEDNIIEFFGRRDFQVKVKGYRIELGEIELALHTIPCVDNAVVKVFQEKDGENYLCAFLTGKELTPGDRETVRTTLKRILPDYLIPSRWVLLDTFPLTPNGKLDRNALSAPDITDQITSDYQMPSDDLERILATTWGELFNIQNVSVNADFFELGGDSIKAIQLVSKMFKQGYQVDIKEIFQYPTISELKRYTKKRILASQKTISGKIPLGPSQRYFFDTHKIDVHHYNMAVLLELKTTTDRNSIAAILNGLCEHHDALRFRFTVEENSVIQVCDAPTNLPLVKELNIEASASLSEAAIGLHESFDLAKGPLISALLINQNEKQFLLLAVHHLVFDGVSWRILLEDFTSLFKLRSNGKTLTLGSKTHSYSEWVDSLNEIVARKDFHQVISYWRTVMMCAVPQIPRRSDAVGMVDHTHFSSIEITLSTQSVTQEMLLAAFVSAIVKQFNVPQVALILESHGRQDLTSDINISRTIGWFSCDYPVIFSMNREMDWPQKVEQVKSTLKSISQVSGISGIGYWMSKYIAEKSLGRELNPQIRFNYMGQLDGDNENELFIMRTGEVGQIHSRKQLSEYDFEVAVSITNNTLDLSIAYDYRLFDPDAVDGLLQTFKDEFSAGVLSIITNGHDNIQPLSIEEISSEDLDHIRKMFN